MMKLKPIGDRVALKRVPAEETTKGGIILSFLENYYPNIFLVVAVGDVAEHEDGGATATLNPGDKVILGKYVGTEITLDGEALLMVHASEILAVLES